MSAADRFITQAFADFDSAPSLRVFAESYGLTYWQAVQFAAFLVLSNKVTQ